MAEVIINVTKDGKATVAAEGWQGPTCATLTDPFCKALGTEIDNVPTAEFYAEESNNQSQEARQ